MDGDGRAHPDKDILRSACQKNVSRAAYLQAPAVDIGKWAFSEPGLLVETRLKLQEPGSFFSQSEVRCQPEPTACSRTAEQNTETRLHD